MTLSMTRSLRLLPLLGVLSLGACAPGYLEVGSAYGPAYAPAYGPAPVVVPGYAVTPGYDRGYRGPSRHWNDRSWAAERRAERRAEHRARERREEWRQHHRGAPVWR